MGSKVGEVSRTMADKTVSEQLQAPEIQTMYSLNMPVSALRTKMRQEFERHRYVNQINVVDMLLTKSHQEFQVGLSGYWGRFGRLFDWNS